jgi:hypothetical protein
VVSFKIPTVLNSKVFRVFGNGAGATQACFEPDLAFCNELCRVAAQDQYGQQFFVLFFCLLISEFLFF